jgi:NADH:ubiquinone oxidoreductase subunit 5 (subunit L)/multisubunit Na+/H+ antiporter MnhA subunit
MYPGFRSADEGRRSTMVVFAAGDLALWAAVILSIAGASDQALIGIGTNAVAGQETIAALVAVLLVIAALSRSAQLPFRSWLPGTIAVPTPVSALLHAGVVNAGGILLLKTSGMFTGSPLATHLAFAAGAATAIYATAAMIARPDVKGSLAHSTAGQMGFMIMTCGLGAWVATIFHLIGHSLYKASLFLGSGSAITSETSRIAKPHPPAEKTPLTSVGFAVLAPAALLSAFALAWYPDLDWTNAAILAFAWATLAWGAWGWIRRSEGIRGTASGAALLALASAGYVGLISLAYDYLGSTIPLEAGSVVSPLWLLAFVPVAIAGLIIRSERMSLPGKADAAAYVQALNAARTGRYRAGRGSTERQLTGTGTLMPRSQEAR